MQNNPISEFEELRKEAQRTMEEVRFEKNTGQGFRIIGGVFLLEFWIVFGIAAYNDLEYALNSLIVGLPLAFIGLIILGFVSLFLALIPFYKKWDWGMRYVRVFQFLVLLLGFPVLTLFFLVFRMA